MAMTIDVGLGIAKNIERIQKMAGLNANFPYQPDQLVETIICLSRAFVELQDVASAKVSKLEAQLRAANARGAKHDKAS
jgi:hypothetical protein